jgi:hypothetical protein
VIPSSPAHRVDRAIIIGDWSDWEDLSVYRPIGVRIPGEPAVGRVADGRHNHQTREARGLPPEVVSGSNNRNA